MRRMEEKERQANTFEHRGNKILSISTNAQYIYIYIYQNYFVISPTCFDASTSSSDILNLLLLLQLKNIKIIIVKVLIIS
jgi:hypothetical protein